MVSEFLIAEEVYEYLHLPLLTFYILTQDKRLSFKVGKHLRFGREDINEWIKQQESLNEPTSKTSRD